MEVTKEQEINQIRMDRPHLVILGAGASLAAFPHGDKNGKKLPLMNNFIKVLGLQGIIDHLGAFQTSNFEEIYSILHQTNNALLNKLEDTIYNYFSRMEIPESPTMYDHLLLSLRPKDYVATFNWDPLLVQAYQRNIGRIKLPKLLFLHGNVSIGYCPEKCSIGINGRICSTCHRSFLPTKLLYPIRQKNYHLDPVIATQWETFQWALRNAFMVTVFGYGAPASDFSAIEMMKNAWGNVNDRYMEEIEIIDIRDDKDLRSTWDPFIHSHHYTTANDFYNSWIANHPRRSGEAYLNQFYDAEFIENNPFPIDTGFEELWGWFDMLQNVEIRSLNYNTTSHII